MKKRRVVLGTSLILAMLLIAGGTFAWFSVSTQVEANQFEAGTLSIELIEETDCPVDNVNPGDCYYKEVKICNTGTKRAVVRISKELHFGGLSTDVVGYEICEPWFECGDYYYYGEVLEPEECTEPLFCENEICFDGPSMGNEYMGRIFTLKLQGHAIQASNGAPEEEWGIEVNENDEVSCPTCPQ